MDPGLAAFLGVLIGSLVTGSVTITAELMRNRSMHRAEIRDREEARLRQRDDFQRENLLSVQVALLEWMRSEVKCFEFDIQQVRATGHLTRLPVNLDSNHHDTTRSLTHLVARITDDSLRDAIRKLTSRAGEIAAENIVLRPEVDVNLLLGQMSELSNIYVEVEDSLGRTLRRYL